MANVLNILDKGTGKYVSVPAIQGDSAYEVAVKNGFQGSETDWLDSLKSTETSVDLSEYPKRTEMNTLLGNKSDKTHTHTQYLTQHQDISGKSDVGHTHILSDIINYKPQDLSSYATKTYVSEMIDSIPGADVDLTGYATTDYVDEAISEIDCNGYTTYKYSAESSYFEDKYNEVGTSFDLPELQTFEGGTRLYIEPTVLIEGDKTYFEDCETCAAIAESGWGTDEDGTGRLYQSNYNYMDNNGQYIELNETEAGTIDDYIVVGCSKDVFRESEPAKYLWYSDTNSKWYISNTEWGMVGTITQKKRVWVYPISQFSVCINGVYQPTDITVTADTSQIQLFTVTQEGYDLLIKDPNDYSSGLGMFGNAVTDTNGSKTCTINTTGYEDGYLIVAYIGSDTGETYLDPFITFTVHSNSFDYVKYKLWTTNADGSESSAKYTITLDKPLLSNEYIRYSSDKIYEKKVMNLYKKEEVLWVNDKEYFTGEYDKDRKPIYAMCIHVEHPLNYSTNDADKSPLKTTVNHNLNVDKYHQIVPTWHRACSSSGIDDMTYLTYTGNCFALDADATYWGTHNVNSSTVTPGNNLGHYYLQVYPGGVNSIVVDRGVNVWNYDCDILIKYTKK